MMAFMLKDSDSGLKNGQLSEGTMAKVIALTRSPSSFPREEQPLPDWPGLAPRISISVASTRLTQGCGERDRSMKQRSYAPLTTRMFLAAKADERSDVASRYFCAKLRAAARYAVTDSKLLSASFTEAASTFLSRTRPAPRV